MRTQLVLLLLAALGACSVAGYKGFDCGQGEGAPLAALTPRSTVVAQLAGLAAFAWLLLAYLCVHSN